MASTRSTGRRTPRIDPSRSSLCLTPRQAASACPIHIGAGVLQLLAELWQPTWEDAVIIGDEQVVAHHGEQVGRLLREHVGRALTLTFPAGEAHKTRAQKTALEQQLLQAGIGRRCCVVALGGGISLDLAGFVAATYMRGVPHVNLPSSLLAQVDACIGGKTGVNTRHGKNLIGVIKQPAAVLVDTDLLATLPGEQWSPGLAEMVKHAVIADPAFFAWLEQHAATLGGPPWTAGVYPIARCLEIKGAIVEQDEQEHGLRRVLNFGHTVGHALEKALGHRLDHGRAVALGMLVEGRLAHALLEFPLPELERLRTLLQRLGLPPRPPRLSLERLLPFLALDKKRNAAGLQLALPLRLGQMAAADAGHTVTATLAELQKAWREEAVA